MSAWSRVRSVMTSFTSPHATPCEHAGRVAIVRLPGEAETGISLLTIPIHRPSVGERELAAISKVFDSRWLGMGTVARAFEMRIEEIVGARHAVAVGSGSAALHLALTRRGSVLFEHRAPVTRQIRWLAETG